MISIICLILFVIGTILFVVSIIPHNTKRNLTKKTKDDFAILIPAKDESKVIEGLLKSINIQVDTMEHTYIIVESLSDKTCLIAKKYGARIVLRHDLSKKRKGYALDDVLKEILPIRDYDLYFIFDADNILDKDFIKNMLESYRNGYDIGVGYRNIKNSDNIISACSGLTFTMVNQLNEMKNKISSVSTISGTGFYISGEILHELNGFPFHSLTEDYELTCFSRIYNLSTFYNKNAIFYDEQPDKMNISIKQRTRWIKGFLEVRQKYLKRLNMPINKKLGIIPYLFMVASIIIFIIYNCVMLFISKFNIEYLLLILYIILGIYFIMLVYSIIVFLIEGKKINISTKMKIKTILFNHIFLSTYLISFIKALIKKDIKWEKIEHNITTLK